MCTCCMYCMFLSSCKINHHRHLALNPPPLPVTTTNNAQQHKQAAAASISASSIIIYTYFMCSSLVVLVQTTTLYRLAQQSSSSSSRIRQSHVRTSTFLQSICHVCVCITIRLDTYLAEISTTSQTTLSNRHHHRSSQHQHDATKGAVGGTSLDPPTTHIPQTIRGYTTVHRTSYHLIHTPHHHPDNLHRIFSRSGSKCIISWYRTGRASGNLPKIMY